jgi:hypothetical protein
MSTQLISMLVGGVGLTFAFTCLAAGQQRGLEGKTAEQAYKNIKVLNGIPADQVTPTMRLIARSLGVTCEFCHDEKDRSKDGLEAKETARKMIKMVRDINTNSFGGRTQVTCTTCHNGHNDPANIPVLPQFSVAVLGPGNEVKPPVLPNVDQVIEKYVQAVGGEQALRKVTSIVVSGMRQNYTPAGDNVPPAIHIEQPVIQVTKRDPDFYPAMNMKEKYQRLRVRGIERLGDREAYVVTGAPQGGGQERFYFDTQSGLLLRYQRRASTAVGNTPLATDYEDYRDAGNGVRMPFVVHIVGPSRPDCATITVEKVQFKP